MCPLALDPEATFEVILESDSEKPAPPAFVFRYLSNRDYRRVARFSDRIHALPSDAIDQLCDEIEQTLMIALVGWRGMVDPATGEEIPFSAENLGRIIDPVEAGELLKRLPEAMSLSVRGKKASGSQSPSSSDASANAATPPGAAETSKPDGQSSSSTAPAAAAPAASAPNAPTADSPSPDAP